jgi:hypothetical protein
MDEPDVFPLNLSYNGDEKNLLSDQDCYESEEFVRFQYTVNAFLHGFKRRYVLGRWFVAGSVDGKHSFQYFGHFL